MDLLNTVWETPLDIKKSLNAGRKEQEVRESLRNLAQKPPEVQEAILHELQKTRGAFHALCESKGMSATSLEYTAEVERLKDRVNAAYNAVKQEFPQQTEVLKRGARYLLQITCYGCGAVKNKILTDDDLDDLTKDTVVMEEEEPAESGMNLHASSGEIGTETGISEDQAAELLTGDSGSSVDAAREGISQMTNPDARSSDAVIQRKAAEKKAEIEAKQKKGKGNQKSEKTSRWKRPKWLGGKG